MDDKIYHVCFEILREYNRAASLFPKFNSAHEGYAVILEELDELKNEVWENNKDRNMEEMKKEALHVAAMAARFIIDIC